MVRDMCLKGLNGMCGAGVGWSGLIHVGLRLDGEVGTEVTRVAHHCIVNKDVVSQAVTRDVSRKESGYSQTSSYVPGSTSGTWISILPSRMSKPEARGSRKQNGYDVSLPIIQYQNVKAATYC